KFYTWSAAEIEKVLGKDAALFNAYYGIREEGNWEHTNILWVQVPLNEFCVQQELQEDTFCGWLADCKQKLMQVREKRIRPLLDDKIILGWNALMNKACTRAYAITGNESYLSLAISNIDFLLGHFRGEDGNWFHVFKREARHPAFLEDLAYLGDALVCLHEVTGNAKWLHEAEILTNHIVNAFSDPETPFFFYTREGQGDVIIRKKEVYDGAVPSSNAMMAKLLHHLSLLLDRPDWGQKSRQMTAALGTATLRYPTSFGNWVCLLQEFVVGTNEISVVGKDHNQLKNSILKEYIPYRVLQVSDCPDQRLPLLRGKDPGENTALWLCKNYACRPAVYTVADLM
ncbi:MAG: thioredoxin domain-containing protein, partial [Sphingomonadales bacterium]